VNGLRWLAGLMDVSLLHPDELDGALLHAWRRMRAADARFASPFLSPEYALAVGAVREDARVVVVRGVDGAVDMILPVQLAGGAGLARPLGAPLCDVAGPVTSMRGVDAELPDVLAEAGIASYVFSGWSEASHARLRQREGSAVADLSCGFAHYLETQRECHAKHYKKMRRLARQGEREFGKLEFTLGPATGGDLATLIGWKREQFLRTRRHDVLGADWTRALLDEVALARTPGFAGLMACLRFNGKLAAAEFGLRSGSVLHGWIAAYDPAFASCSPGLMLQERLLEAAAEMGVTQAVLGTGEGHYKKHYASYMTPVDEGLVTATGFAGGARALAGGLLNALETGRLGPASRLAGRTRRRLDVILAVETRMTDQMRGLIRAIGGEPAMARTGTVVRAGARASGF
jgi:CelD/BcsL family acetyltransferase involved in cellulose biosynthesis